MGDTLLDAGGRDGAASDGDIAAVVFDVIAGASADARAPVTAAGHDGAVVDGNGAAGLAVCLGTAADACAFWTALGLDRAVVDGNGAARSVAAADASILTFASGKQLAYVFVFALGVDAQGIGNAVGRRHVDALQTCQVAAVHQNQLDVAGYCHAVVNDHVTEGCYIGPGLPVGVYI